MLSVGRLKLVKQNIAGDALSQTVLTTHLVSLDKNENWLIGQIFFVEVIFFLEE